MVGNSTYAKNYTLFFNQFLAISDAYADQLKTNNHSSDSLEIESKFYALVERGSSDARLFQWALINSCHFSATAPKLWTCSAVMKAQFLVSFKIQVKILEIEKSFLFF